MKISLILRIIICIIFGSLFRLDGLQAQVTQEITQDTTRFIDKLEIGTGIGVDHGIMGVKFQYLISENVTLYSGFGPFILIGHTPVLGVEYNFKSIKRYKKLNPYLMAQVGRDYGLRLSHQVDPLNQPWIVERDNKLFMSASLGIGIRYKASESVKLNVGVSYRIVDYKKIQDYTDSFYSEFGIQRELTHRKVLPMLGISVPFVNLLELVGDMRDNIANIF